MVIGEKFRFSSFLVLILVYKHKHHNADYHKGNHGNSHSDPKQQVCVSAMLRRYGEIVGVKVRKRIPEKPTQASYHEHYKKRGINLIRCTYLVVIVAFRNAYKAADSVDHVKDRQNQNNTEKN